MSFDEVKNIAKIEPEENISIQDAMQKRLVAQDSPEAVDFQDIIQQAGINSGDKQKTTIDIDTKIDDRNRNLPSIMEEASRVGGRVDNYRENLSVDSLISNSEKAAKTIGQLKESLDNPNIQLKDSIQKLLENKLNNIDDNIKIALSKVGEKYSPMESNKALEPVERFIGMLAYGQKSLNSMGAKIQSFAESGKPLSPAEMITVQIKMHTVVQELEFFTSLLSKSLESIKTVMNVQV